MNKDEINSLEVVEAETGCRFTNNAMCCPFHKEKTPSFHYNPKTKKFRCFGSCDKSWDAIDFIQEWKNLNYIEACKYLNIDIPKEYLKIEDEKTKVLGYINWQLQKQNDKKDWSLDTIYVFTDDTNKALYYKAKFKTPQGKQARYYRINNRGAVKNTLKNSQGEKVVPEVPYNLYRLTGAIKNNKPIYIVEGEKDADTLNNRGYTATSLKGRFEDYNWEIFNNANVYIIGDTGIAGAKYINEIKHKLKNICAKLHVVTLPYIENIGDGDNIDVTDWFQDGHSKEEFDKALRRSLDLNNKNELQQNNFGVYKHYVKLNSDGEVIKEGDIYLTNFCIVKAITTKYEDAEKEGIELTLKNSEGEIFIRSGDVTKFDDIKSFKNFLNSIGLMFKGNIDDLTNLKIWIYKFFACEVNYIFEGIQFKDKKLVTPKYSITKDAIISNESCTSSTQIELGLDAINKTELDRLIINLLNFNCQEIVFSMLGTIIHNMCINFSRKANVRLHHMLTIGESGSGKSTIKRNVVNPLLGYNNSFEGYAMDKITDFALTKILSEGNYTAVFDEFKPSKMSDYKLSTISSTLRSLYDNGSISRGRKDMTLKEYPLKRPVVIFGEEGYPHNERALMDRSIINYISINERTAENTKAMEYLKKNTKLLNKLGNAILQHILSMTFEEYMEMRDRYKDVTSLTDRPLESFINASVGCEILERVNISLEGVNPILGYSEAIERNIRKNILPTNENNNTIYEEMLINFDTMIESNLIGAESGIYVINGKRTCIRVHRMLEQLSKHKKDYGLNYPLLSKTDFMTQCEKSGLITNKNKTVKYPKEIIEFVPQERVKMSEFNMTKLYKLGCFNLLDQSFINKMNEAIEEGAEILE